MRTVAVVAPYYPPQVGGVERYAARLARAAAGQPDLRPVVITTRRGLRTTDTVEDGVRVLRLGAWLRVSNTPLSPLWPLQLRYWLRRLDVRLVTAHAPVPGLGDLAVALSGRRRRTLLTYHAGSMAKGSAAADLLIGAYERHVLPRVFARCDALVSVSPVSLADAVPGSVRITPGVDTAVFTPGPPPSRRPPTLLYVGRIDRSSAWKGVDVLVRAFAELAEEVPEARLRLVGGGDALADHLRLAGALGVAGRVDADGELSGRALVEAVRGAAALVLPSRTEAESFGMALIEAMACGTPVVGSRVGGIPSVVTEGETGLLVPPGEPAALAEACRLLLRDAELSDRLGAAGREAAERDYAWPDLTTHHLHLWRELLAQPRAQRRRRK
ncbi:glycosyltransferase family 4 protein [Phaeacidiphilus oryzae]|uniref:glycosyltransferase family 4 protein n=1 Tax=Phaeacidiphilus oryzae TaxID=348818 RepID=UPI00055D9B74|nr:glycosyltransferase [Phaeacidiphilus oryzae]